MPQNVTIVTPENITVTYQVAGFASRFLAAIVDTLLRGLIVLFLGFAFRLFAGSVQFIGLHISDVIVGLSLVISFFVWFFYSVLFEMLWGGRTPGKRMLGLRVIRDGGYPIDITSSAVRNILILLDIGIMWFGVPLVLCGLPGILSIFFSPQYKRLGDYAAGTLVIVEGGINTFQGRRNTTALMPEAAALAPLIRNIERITPEEYRAIRRYVEQRSGWDIPVQAALSERLARPLLQKLEIKPEINYQLQYALWLEAMERLYSEEHHLL